MIDSKHCKYCGEAFDEEEGYIESVKTPGVCEILRATIESTWLS